MVMRESWRSREAYNGRSPEKKVSEIFIFFGMTGLGIEIALYCLFLGSGKGLVGDLNIVELGEERELGIDGAEDGKPHPIPPLKGRGREHRNSHQFTVAGKDDGLGDFGQGIDEGFDIVRADVLAVGEDDNILLQTAFHIEIAVFIQVAFVAGMKPAVGVNLPGGSFGVFVIAEHDILAFDKDLTGRGDATSQVITQATRRSHLIYIRSYHTYKRTCLCHTISHCDWNSNPAFSSFSIFLTKAGTIVIKKDCDKSIEENKV